MIRSRSVCAVLGTVILSLSGGQAMAQTKSVATNMQGFGVPFRVNANDDSFVEVQLYLSKDEGKSWQFHSRQSTDGDEFPFFAEGDGTYWFALKTLNRDRRLIPEGDIVKPELEIIVDTKDPELEFRIETDSAGRVACRWRASDKNIRPDSLKILYQPGQTGQVAGDGWHAVDVKLADPKIPASGIYADQIAWWPAPDVRELTVRLQISDAAGNVVQEDRQVVLPLVAWRSRSSSTARPAGRSAASPSPPLSMNPKKRAGDRPHEIASKSDHPAGVVCENGVCRRVSLPKRLAKKPALKPALKPASELYGQAVPRPHAPVTRPAPIALPTRSPSAARSTTVRSSRSSHRSISRQPLPRTARAQVPQTISPSLNLVGSDVEAVAPPVPRGYVPALPNGQVPESLAGRPAVAWQSQAYRWGPKNQSAFSSTLKPDPSLSPSQISDRRLPVRSLIPTNPSINFQEGDQQIAQSSTNFPNNQYQGIGPSVPSDVIENNPPQLLPRNNSAGPLASGRRKRVSETVVQRSANSNSLGPLQNYPNSVYHRSSYAKRGAASSSSAIAEAQTTQRARQSSSDRAALQMISTKRFRLDYAINAIDPSGVAKVDLWMTRDNGRSWELWGSDPDNASPFPVQVNDEGRYGFRVVIHSRDGLTGQGPSRGDQPDMYIHVDSQPPLAKITSVPYGRGNEVGKLVINWSVSDPFLSLRPIRLSYSRGPAGPWTVIDDGLRNVGRYVWKVEPNVPERVFLKIEATDQAGNVGVHQLSQTIDISGLVPRGTIRGVVPVK